MAKTVLITGANSGFGYLSTLKFAREGYKVYATTRSLEKTGVLDINRLATEEALDISWLKLDVTKDEHINEVAQAITKEGHLDILVNNAGYGLMGRIEDLSIEFIRKQFDTNFFGVINLTKALLPLLKESKGRIINLSSIAGRVSAATMGAYASSKFALEAMSEALNAELKSSEVEVILVEPGGFDTKFGKNVVSAKKEVSFDDSWFSRLLDGLKKGPLKNIRSPQHVADKIYHVGTIKSPKLRYLVGLDANMIGFIKKVIPDRIWDWMLSSVS